MKNQPVIINSDIILEGKNFTDTDCGWKTAYLDVYHNYEPSWGSIFGYSKKYNSWMQLFDFHFWSYDGDNILDSYSGIRSQTGLWPMNVKTPSKYTYKLLHQSDFDFSKTSVHLWKGIIEGKKNPIVKQLNRCYSPDKYDFIYIEDIFHNPQIKDSWLYDEECEEFYKGYYTGMSINENIRCIYTRDKTGEIAGYCTSTPFPVYLPNGKIVNNLEELEEIEKETLSLPK